MVVKITLTSTGSDSGPFDIYSNSTGSFVLIASGINKVDIVAGYTISVPDGTTIVRVQSTGECTNYQDIPIQITTTQPPSGCKEFISFDYKTTNDLPVRYKICGSNDWVYYTFTGLPFTGGVYTTYTIDLEFPDGLCIQDGSWEYLGTEGGTPNMNNFVYGNTCTPLPALCYQIDGIWVDPDPVHPGGGTLTYVDENYQLQTITGIWEGFNQLITIRDVIYHVGVNGFNAPVQC